MTNTITLNANSGTVGVNTTTTATVPTGTTTTWPTYPMVARLPLSATPGDIVNFMGVIYLWDGHQWLLQAMTTPTTMPPGWQQTPPTPGWQTATLTPAALHQDLVTHEDDVVYRYTRIRVQLCADLVALDARSRSGRRDQVYLDEDELSDLIDKLIDKLCDLRDANIAKKAGDI